MKLLWWSSMVNSCPPASRAGRRHRIPMGNRYIPRYSPTQRHNERKCLIWQSVYITQVLRLKDVIRSLLNSSTAGLNLVKKDDQIVRVYIVTEHLVPFLSKVWLLELDDTKTITKKLRIWRFHYLNNNYNVAIGKFYLQTPVIFKCIFNRNVLLDFSS